MIKIRQIKVSIDKDSHNHLLDKVSHILGINKDDINSLKINKRSIDARDKNNILYIYEVLVSINNEDEILKNNKSKDILKYEERRKVFNVTGETVIPSRPIIIGFGPSGLFLSYMLAKYGFKPLVFERGDQIDVRVKKVEDFWSKGVLDESTNVQFGEGGAGTFSDGKLNTLVKDKENIQEEIFRIFVKHGADESIMYYYKPHIGTDVLRKVVKSMREEIIKMGGEIHFNSCMTDLEIDNKIKSITINNKDKISCDSLFLCLGHSARDTFKLLNSKGIDMSSKPFAVGVRIIHDEKKITNSLFNTNKLGPASYKLTHKTKEGRGVYTFCMCPGGYVVNASSINNHLTINGMSDFKRDSGYSNSAIICQVTPKDYGDGLFDGVKFQESLERKAFDLSNGLIPIELYKDYKLGNNPSKSFDNHNGIKGEFDFKDINKIFPDYINNTIKEGIEEFGNKIKGFNDDDSIILGVESRTSSPIRINRDEYGETNIKGIYAIGEGSGYAGGITTSALDAVKIFEKFISIYKHM